MGTGSKCIGRNKMNNQGKNLVQLKEPYNCLKIGDADHKFQAVKESSNNYSQKCCVCN